MASVFSSTFAGATYYRDRDNGVLRLLLTAPHSLRVLLAGKALAGAVLALVQALVVFAVAAPFLDLEWQHGLFAGLVVALVAAALLNVVLAGLGQSLATRISTMQGFHLVMNLGLFPLLFVSGAFFPIDDLPAWLQVIAYANPLTYAVDALQLAAYARNGDAFIGLPVDFAVLGGLALVFGVLGFSRTPRATWSGK
jgi:ABC-2 type transport system permease protein